MLHIHIYAIYMIGSWKDGSVIQNQFNNNNNENYLRGHMKSTSGLHVLACKYTDRL